MSVQVTSASLQTASFSAIFAFIKMKPRQTCVQKPLADSRLEKLYMPLGKIRNLYRMCDFGQGVLETAPILCEVSFVVEAEV